MRMNAYFIIKALYLMSLPVTFVFHYNSLDLQEERSLLEDDAKK